ncbi:glycosyl hydrolase family 115 (putative glucuronidase) [Nitrospirillum amazonense]|uniref:Glycosyl hydrolase family 115 (Putative glucuronidase) n=1 Tax=Nitrospirillum amazonense TaxID=28077 RepID=A0A560JGT8_9PROT|nr:glycosyl hydrolase 115 family protein [Nitrospirillum amazonense]TWB69749.1 glycosyl hydrolase family 115 (putative glucuronidase) [Nitrospirillum amazonense]
MKRFIRSLLLATATVALAPQAWALGQPRYVEAQATPGGFAIVQGGVAARLHVDAQDYAGVQRAARDLAADIGKVTGVTPAISQDTDLGALPILVGTLGHSPTIDRLAAEGRIDAGVLKGKWEAFRIQVVANPAPGIASALVIAGSDKRGTIYGLYDVSEQIGVSPWAWWADVPVRHRDSLYVKAGTYGEDPAPVKYRGIFLNDEAPALTGWAREKFGGLNHQFYEHVFELILRLKGNYLWPAMWGNAFNEDDPLNPKIADEYGVVMGNSHHEPMLRSQQEWKRHGTGPWDYAQNGEVLRQFWSDGVRRNKDFESIVTIGMRGDGDMPMTGDAAAANTALLEKIVADQRQILAKEVNPDVTQIPQIWALYKEVQEYYEKGMRVPDDVTLLWCDDNWGDVRRLPTAEERKRPGGAGMYYHFDYVGDPRNYKWINTNSIPKVWEQMNLTLEYGADRVWIVNVGDLKPMELPIEFFLDYARDPKRWPKEKLPEFTAAWAEREFGPEHAAEIATLVTRYGMLISRRKPELLDANTFSLTDYREAERVVADYQDLVAKAEAIYQALPADARDAFFQLVLHPAKAAAQVTELYVAVGRNRLYADQGRASANAEAAKAKALFQADADLTKQYHALNGGKWDHMMDQPHIGYTSWREPLADIMPEIRELSLPAEAKLGVAVEGKTQAWPALDGKPMKDAAVLPDLDVTNKPSRYIDVFNRGSKPFAYTAKASAPWIILSQAKGTVTEETRLQVAVDWAKAPAGTSPGSVTITGAGGSVTVHLRALNTPVPQDGQPAFIAADGYVSMEAEHYTGKADAGVAAWQKIPNYGRTLSGLAPFPVTSASFAAGQGPRLDYRVYLPAAGPLTVQAIVGPTLNFVPGRGLRYAVAIDDEAPQVVDILALNGVADWSKSVEDNARKPTSHHTVASAGYHTLHIWMVDPAVVLTKLVVDLGGVKPTYLGPPESARVAAR